MDEKFMTGAVIALLCAAALAAYWTQARLRRAALARWAAENRFTILESSSVELTEATPFWVTASKAQAIYRVVVSTSDGTTRAGWVRLGSWWGGDDEVRWNA